MATANLLWTFKPLWDPAKRVLEATCRAWFKYTTNCRVTLGRLLSLSELQVPHLWSRANYKFLEGLLRRLHKKTGNVAVVPKGLYTQFAPFFPVPLCTFKPSYDFDGRWGISTLGYLWVEMLSGFGLPYPKEWASADVGGGSLPSSLLVPELSVTGGLGFFVSEATLWVT